MSSNRNNPPDELNFDDYKTIEGTRCEIGIPEALFKKVDPGLLSMIAKENNKKEEEHIQFKTPGKKNSNS